MKGKNIILLLGAGVAIYGAWYFFIRKPKPGEKKSNASGTKRTTIGPCSPNLTDDKCQNACSTKYNGRYNQGDRTCTYRPMSASSQNIAVRTKRKIVTV